jgi:hypothetical protein
VSAGHDLADLVGAWNHDNKPTKLKHPRKIYMDICWCNISYLFVSVWSPNAPIQNNERLSHKHGYAQQTSRNKLSFAQLWYITDASATDLCPTHGCCR